MDNKPRETEEKQERPVPLGLWEETINPVTGQSSIQNHVVKVLSVGCKTGKHFYEFDGNPQREARCKYCPTIARFIVGFHTIVEGKIIRIV